MKINIIALIFLIVLGILSFYNLYNYLDISFYDEANYMYRGLYLGKVYVEPENGGFYSIWYFFLSFFQSNPVSLYYLNGAITIILPAIFLFFTLKAYKVNTIISWTFSIFLMYSTLNVTNWPRVSNFCICFILLGLILFKKTNSQFLKFYFLTFISFIVSYIRPEFFISFLFLVPISIAFLLKKDSRKKKTNYFLIAFFYRYSNNS